MDTDAYRHMVEEVRQMDMVDYLFRQGHEPVKVRNDDYWYLSPLRGEHTPSFKVNRNMNRWYDHGLGKGGNIIDFGVLYHSCSVSEFLHLVGSDFSFHQPVAHRLAAPVTEHRITVLKDGPLSSFPLLRYLGQRKIPVAVAALFCREVSYGLNGKNYYGIGFRNDSGGFELRNPYFKASSSPKGITTISCGSPEVKVFEGFMDFLSFRAAYSGEDLKTDVVVLNSLSFFEKARPFMEAHERIGLYLDRDDAGQNCSRKAVDFDSRYKDESRLYKGFKDVNDWLANGSRDSSKKRRLKL